MTGLALNVPDRSLVRSSTASRALEAIAKVNGMEAKVVGIDEAEDRVRRTVLERFARLGRAPTRKEIGDETGLSQRAVSEWLESLSERDLVVLDGASGALAVAYPLSERETGHRVRLGRRTLNAMCAIDALGVGDMYRADVSIASACRSCGQPIEIATAGRGTRLGAVSPTGVVVWSGIQYAEGRAATSLCPVLTFFCGDPHLERWRRENHPDIEGFRLTPGEAMEVGRAIFANMLRPAEAPASPA